MADKVVVFFGPRKAFDELLTERRSPNEYSVSYLDSVRMYNSRIRASDLVTSNTKIDIPEYVDSCVVHANDFGSVLSHVISSFATILEETFDAGTIYVQNPPKRAYESLLAAHAPEQIETIYHPYIEISKPILQDAYRVMQKDVLGQDTCKKAVVSALYRLSTIKKHRPAVILMYGPSGVGKTEISKSISGAMGGGLTRVQFSMMQTTEAYEYLYGAEHSKASFARDLLGRESNVVLIDEFDKVNPNLYNMFYQLFDEGVFTDTNYEVDIHDGLFLLTSNFSSEREIKKVLGPAMYSRIDEAIQFEDLPDSLKLVIANSHYESIIEQLPEDDRNQIERSDIRFWFQDNIARYDNMRTLKIRIERAIFDLLTAKLISESSQSAS